MIVDRVRYTAGGRSGELPSVADAGTMTHEADGFVWVASCDPAAQELEELARAFDLPRSPVDDRAPRFPRPKLERDGERTILAVTTVHLDATGTRLETGVVDLVVGAGWAIAIGRSSGDVLEGASERLSAHPEVVALGPMAAVWALLDAVIEGSERVVDGLGDQVEEVQVAVFEGHQDQSEAIYLQLQETARFTRAMHPMLTVLDRLERRELVEEPEALAPLLGDVSDHARRLSEEVRMLGEALEGLLDANVARVTVHQNVIIQQVSAWAAIAAVATIITGVYGMNFRHMPELDWLYGYPMAIAIIIATVVVLRWYFTRVGWL